MVRLKSILNHAQQEKVGFLRPRSGREALPGGRTEHHFCRNQSKPQLPGPAQDCSGTALEKWVGKD